MTPTAYRRVAVSFNSAPLTTFQASLSFQEYLSTLKLVNDDFPVMHWRKEFTAIDGGTKVVNEITFDTLADLEKILSLGFEEGTTLANTNLDALLG